MERLDKVLSNSGIGSRKEVKGLIKKGMVKVNGRKVTDEAFKVNPREDSFTVDEEEVNYKKYIYIQLNKPEGVISATEDDYDRTVIDLLSDEQRKFLPYPVGRLDKDTEGLLILTNNGELNHRLISPKWHVVKTYRAVLRDDIDEEYYREKIREGIIIDDGYKCLPGEFILKSREEKVIELSISEGKFHQVKRMFEALGNKVEYLERISFGSITLDENLKRGQYRELTEEEKRKLFSDAKLNEKDF